MVCMDKPHIEKEYKMAISEEIYTKMLIDLNIEPFKQTNHYYYTYSKEHAMRIREIDNKFIFTLKVKGDGFKYEYEFEIKDNSLNDERIKELLNRFNIDKTFYLGYMDTYRATKDYNFGQLCLDKSMYLGKTDYELEFELFDYQNDDKSEFDELLSKYGLVFINNKTSKFKRFLDALGKNI